MTAEYVWPDHVNGYPMRITRDDDCSPGCRYVATPMSDVPEGEWDTLGGLLAAGATPYEAIEAARELWHHFVEPGCKLWPPAALPVVTMRDVSWQS